MAKQEDNLREAGLYRALKQRRIKRKTGEIYMEKDNKTLGQRIAHYRKLRGITQEELGEKCGVSSQAVSKWENDISAPDITLIGTLSEIFGISADELLGLKREVATAVKPETIDEERLLLRVNIDSNDGDKVRINVPYKLGLVLMQSGAVGDKNSDALKNIDFKQIAEMVKMGILGPIVDIESADGYKVKITVEQM